MSAVRMAGLPAVRTMAKVLFALSLAALLAITVAGGRPYGASSGRIALASSSSPFAASSPATTLPSSSAATATTTPTVVHTGEAWGSGWFLWLLALTILFGVAAIWPAVARRQGVEPDSALSAP